MQLSVPGLWCRRYWLSVQYSLVDLFFFCHYNIVYVLSLKHFLFIVSFSSITWWSDFSSTGNFSNKTQFRNMSSTNYNLIQDLILPIFASLSEVWKSRNRGSVDVVKWRSSRLNWSTYQPRVVIVPENADFTQLLCTETEQVNVPFSGYRSPYFTDWRMFFIFIETPFKHSGSKNMCCLVAASLQPTPKFMLPHYFLIFEIRI